jgi:hypothetical protein
MRLLGLRLPTLAVLFLAFGATSGRAQVLYLETADWVPTASVMALPTAYVMTGTYVVPSSYTIPSIYATAYVTESALLAPTSYVAPTYYETRFRRRGLFGRRLVATTRSVYLPTTTYYPTTYYYPTVFSTSRVLDTAVVPTGYTTARWNDCCEGEVIASVTPEIRSYPAPTAPAAPSLRSESRPRRAPLRSQPADDDSTDSNVPELPAREPVARPDTGGAGRLESPPAPPVPTREQSTAQPTGSGNLQNKPASPQLGSPTGTAQPKSTSPRTSTPAPVAPDGVDRPTAPAGVDDLQKAPSSGEETSGAATGSGSERRTTQRPAFSTTRVLRSDYRNVLFGRVKARDSNEPEEGVRVTISNRTNSYADRVALTDAFGRFAVKVPDGDWTVNVAMPSGRTYSVSQITVSNGLISDDIGRDIPSLVITR